MRHVEDEVKDYEVERVRADETLTAQRCEWDGDGARRAERDDIEHEVDSTRKEGDEHNERRQWAHEQPGPQLDDVDTCKNAAEGVAATAV